MKKYVKARLAAAVTASVVIATVLLSPMPALSYLPEPMNEGTLVIDQRPSDPKEYLYWKYPKEATVLDKVINCESGWKTSAKNKNSSASGLAQFISSTWVSVRKQMGRNPDLALRFDGHENVDSAVWLYRNNGLGPWECATKGMI